MPRDGFLGTRASSSFRRRRRMLAGRRRDASFIRAGDGKKLLRGHLARRFHRRVFTDERHFQAARLLVAFSSSFSPRRRLGRYCFLFRPRQNFFAFLLFLLLFVFFALHPTPNRCRRRFSGGVQPSFAHAFVLRVGQNKTQRRRRLRRESNLVHRGKGSHAWDDRHSSFSAFVASAAQ